MQSTTSSLLSAATRLTRLSERLANCSSLPLGEVAQLPEYQLSLPFPETTQKAEAISQPSQIPLPKVQPQVQGPERLSISPLVLRFASE